MTIRVLIATDEPALNAPWSWRRSLGFMALVCGIGWGAVLAAVIR